MKTRVTYFLLFITMQLFTLDVFAQSEFTNIYGSSSNDLFNYVNYHAPSNTFFAAGVSNDQAALSRIASDGTLMWTRTYAEHHSELNNFAFTPNNELMLAGRSANRVIRVKVLAQSPTSDFYFVTALVSFTTGNHSNNEWDNLAKILINGEGQEYQDGNGVYFGNPDDDNQIYDVITDNGCVYFCGNTAEGLTDDNRLSYINRGCGTDETTISVKNRFRFGFSFGNRLLSLIRTHDDGFLLVGINVFQEGNITNGDGIILRLNRDREIVWRKIIADGIAINSVVEMDDETIVVSRVQSSSLELIHLDENGNFISAQRINNINGAVTPGSRLEHTGGANDRVIAYTAKAGSSSPFGSNDPMLIVINPSNISCEATATNPTISDIGGKTTGHSLPAIEFPFSAIPNTGSTLEDSWQSDDLCCDGPINCQERSQLSACSEENTYGYIHLKCPAANSYTWDLPNNSDAFEISGNGSSTILNAGEGVYSVTITDGNGCSEVKTYEIEEDCCEEDCGAPTGLDCSGFGTFAQLSWNAVPGATSYYVTINPNSSCCGGNASTNIIYPLTLGTTQTGPVTSSSRCYKDGECFFIADTPDDRPRLGKPNPSTEPNVYPNPSTGSLNFEFDAEEDLTINVEVYSIDGKLVKAFAEETYPDGFYKKSWNAEEQLTDGIYYIFFKTNLGSFQKKVIISKEGGNLKK